MPWFLRLGGRGHVFDDAEAERYAAPLREGARARASQQLYRSYLRAARDVFFRKPYAGQRLTVPTRAVFGREDFYIPVASTLGAEPYADDWSVRAARRLRALDAGGAPRGRRRDGARPVQPTCGPPS